MRPICGLSSCAARSRMHDALAALLVATAGVPVAQPRERAPGSPNLSSRFFTEPLALFLAGDAREVDHALHAKFAQPARQPAAWVLDPPAAVDVVVATSAYIAPDQDQALRLQLALPCLDDETQRDSSGRGLLRP